MFTIYPIAAEFWTVNLPLKIQDNTTTSRNLHQLRQQITNNKKKNFEKISNWVYLISFISYFFLQIILKLINLIATTTIEEELTKRKKDTIFIYVISFHHNYIPKLMAKYKSAPSSLTPLSLLVFLVRLFIHSFLFSFCFVSSLLTRHLAIICMQSCFDWIFILRDIWCH